MTARATLERRPPDASKIPQPKSYYHFATSNRTLRHPRQTTPVTEPEISQREDRAQRWDY